MIRKIIENLYFGYLERDTEVQEYTDIEREKVFDELRENDDYKGLLRAIMKGDIQRYFNTRDENAKKIIRGEYQRTSYLLHSLRKKEKLTSKVDKTDTKIAGRYA